MMMKISKYCLFIVFIIIAFPKHSWGLDRYTITGNISGDLHGGEVYLFFGSQYLSPLDSAVMKNGSFKIEGIAASPHLYHILIVEKGKVHAIHRDVSLFLENSDITITANLDSIPTSDLLREHIYPYNKVKIVGSKSHDLFLKYFNGNSVFRKKIADANHIYTSYLKEKRTDLERNTGQGIEMTVAIDAARKERVEYVKQFVKDNPGNAVSLAVIEMNLSNFSANEIEELFSCLSPKLRKDGYEQELEQNATIVKKTAVGAKYVDFSFQDKDDNNIKLSDYLGKGKYVLLELWASWCGPCIKDLPHLKNVYALYHPSGFEIMQISLDDNKEKWLSAVKEQQMEWLQVTDLKAFKGGFAKAYNIDSIPTCILIGPDGEILDRNMREAWMDKKLIELYGNKFADK